MYGTARTAKRLLRFGTACLLAVLACAASVAMAVEMTPRMLVPVGHTVGIKLFSKGVVVVKLTDGGTPARACGLRTGDVIVQCGGDAVTSSEQFQSLLQTCGGTAELEVRRNGDSMTLSVEPERNDRGVYCIGAWIRDSMAGIGTMTYYTIDKEFGALGHGIGDGVTENLLSVHDGDLYNMSLQRIDRGMAGKPGQVAGTIYFGGKSHIGHLDNNLNIGIYGTLDDEDYTAYSETDHLYEAAHKQDIEIGSAQIISEVSGELKTYDVKITEVDLGTKDENKGIVLQITDDELIELTGGIIQGMSGSPIIQNGRIIGAVTHVFVNDPTQGYGIFIENMLER